MSGTSTRPSPTRESLIRLFDQANAEIAKINVGISNQQQAHAAQLQNLRNEFQTTLDESLAEQERRVMAIIAAAQTLQGQLPSQGTSQNPPSVTPQIPVAQTPNPVMQNRNK